MLYAAWGTFKSRRPMDLQAEREWRKHVHKVKDRLKNVKLTSDIKESTNVLHQKPKPVKKPNEFDVLRRRGDHETRDWMGELRQMTIQDGVERERERRQNKAREQELQRQEERERRAEREAERREGQNSRQSMLQQQRRQNIESRKLETDERRRKIVHEKEEFREKVLREREKRLLGQAWSNLSNMQSYEDKRQRYLEAQREREAATSSRLEQAEQELQHNKQRYMTQRRRRSVTSAATSVSQKANSVPIESDGEAENSGDTQTCSEIGLPNAARLDQTKSRGTDKSYRTRRGPASRETDDLDWLKTGIKKRFTPWKQDLADNRGALAETLTERRARTRQNKIAERDKSNSKFMWKLVSTKPATRTRMSSSEELEHIRQLRYLSHSDVRDELGDQLHHIGKKLQQSKPELYHQLFGRPRKSADVLPLKSRVRPADSHWR